MITIHLFLDGATHGTRLWPHVPRVGDRVLVPRGRTLIQPKVVEVVWGAPSMRTGEFFCEASVYLLTQQTKAEHGID